MKTIRISVLLFSILLAFACNNKQSDKTKEDESVVKKLLTGKSIFKKQEKAELNKYKSCESIVKEILTTSPRYCQLTKGLNKAVVKNGGQSFGITLEGSPNPLHDKAWGYSETYDFTIYENYMDRQLKTARFSFNPNNKQLYEYDAVNDQLKPIKFDRKLLLKYEALCR